jgi:5'-3' exonuclease
MGIKHLNKFLRVECAKSITCMDMKELTNKTIVIDISIYMYKYQTDGTLIENIYLMLSLFKHYRIVPIFIFDGKPPIEKRELLRQRYIDKMVAEAEYNRLSALLEQESLDKGDLVYEMELLKKKIIYLTKKQIASVKTLIHAFGATYYDAPNEADELCALFVLKNKAWACMSEDMDMFVYGVPRVIRYFSLLNHTIVLYNTSSILQELSMTQKEFSEVCILSGTDYNLSSSNSSSHNRQVVAGYGSPLNDSVRLFKQYKSYCYVDGFYDWLLKENLVGHDEYTSLNHIYKMFINETSECVIIVDNIKTTSYNLLVCRDKLRSILEEDGFIYK